MRDSDEEPLLDHASRDLITLKPDDLGITALHRMIEEHVEHLPVVVDGRLVGICTRTDLVHVRRRQIEQERTQPGVRPFLWRRPEPA